MRIKLFQEKKGQAMVETALILPLILLILMGIIDFGLVFNNYLVITNASREAARAAVVGSTDVQINTIIQNMTNRLDSAKMQTTITPSEATRKRGDEITVSIRYDNDLITPIISALLSGTLRVRAATVMRME